MTEKIVFIVEVAMPKQAKAFRTFCRSMGLNVVETTSEPGICTASAEPYLDPVNYMSQVVSRHDLFEVAR